MIQVKKRSIVVVLTIVTAAPYNSSIAIGSKSSQSSDLNYKVDSYTKKFIHPSVHNYDPPSL